MKEDTIVTTKATMTIGWEIVGRLPLTLIDESAVLKRRYKAKRPGLTSPSMIPANTRADTMIYSVVKGSDALIRATTRARKAQEIASSTAAAEMTITPTGV